jgi:hypothetical protein
MDLISHSKGNPVRFEPADVDATPSGGCRRETAHFASLAKIAPLRPDLQELAWSATGTFHSGAL